MDTTHCISDTMWEGYAQKTLSPADMLTLQKHAEVCELCADIKEGIDNLSNPETLPQIVAQINADVDTYLKPKRKKLTILWYSSAAAVVLVALGIVWYNMPVLPNEQVAQNNSQQQENAVIDTNSQKAATHDIEELSTESEQVKKGTEPKTENIADGSLVATNNSADDTQNDLDVLGDEKEGKKQAIEFIAPIDTTTYSDDAETPQVVDLLKKETKRDIYPSNMSTNNNLNNFNNLNTNTRVFSPQQDSINYANALAYYDAKQYDSCLLSIQNIIFSPLPYNELAALLKAKTLIKQNQPLQANEVLKGTVFTDKKRKNEAEKLLKSIN